MLKTNISRLFGWTIFFLALIGVSAFVTGKLFSVSANTGENKDQQRTNPDSPVTKLAFDGVTMSVAGAHQEGEYFQTDICFSLPDDRDWLLTSRPDDAVLNVNGQIYTVSEEGVLDIRVASDGVGIEKCQYLLFPVKVDDGADLSLFLNKIYVSEPDKVDCPTLQKQLDEKKSKITVSCPTEPNVGGFGVIQKPLSMDNETAYEFALDILTDARRAPWVFYFKFAHP
ncbi:MAG: hypothetical protein CNIPEHKO_01236 [Anaerolineales bacterium]|nr:hypothetical protein [Anaerolineales bacterium]